MKHTYHIFVNMPSSKFKEVILADKIKFKEGRINFYKELKNNYLDVALLCSYPSEYTIIEKIENNENN